MVEAEKSLTWGEKHLCEKCKTGWSGCGCSALKDDDRWCACDTYLPACKKDGFEICDYCEMPIPLSTSHRFGWRKRYGSYLEYLYVENPPEMEWDGEKWIQKQNA
jgi:hypothetical protein